MRPRLIFPVVLMIASMACRVASIPSGPAATPPADTVPSLAPTTVILPTQTNTTTETPPVSETASPLPSNTAIPTVESLKAKVTTDLLSCRYGPGAEYLYLYALKAGANIELIGRTDANNWVWVDGKNKCWVNAKFLEIAGDKLSLPVVYPGIAKLPISPYYPPSHWAKATRNGTSVQVMWEEVPISPGKYEDANMHQYIVEVWRCEKGQIVFETLGTNFPFITIENDE